jgi:predicted ATPase
MRIKSLYLSDYRNLRDFLITFDTQEPNTVLIGHNSTGKSNLIEVLVEIFRELDSGKPTDFHYRIEYSCYGNDILVECDPEGSPRLQIKINGEDSSLAAFNREKHEYLPAYIFGYYSGWSDRLEKQFDEKTRRYYYDVLRNPDDDMPLRRFFFSRKEYSQLVLLAFFLADDPRAKQLLNKYLQIADFESALFVMNRPWWGQSGRSKRDDEAADPRFWNARGAFRPFLSRLWESALAPIRSEETIERDIRRKGESTERLYLFIKDEQHLVELQQQYESIKLFFANLESLYLCDLVDEVRIKVKKTDGSLVTFKALSEGEQQLLTVLGLLLFTQDDESLYLLDEPNTHLNPVWTYEFIELLKGNLQAHEGQMIIATHDPLMVGNLYRNQVRLFRQGSDESAFADEPEYDPIGLGVEGLLKSELYGLRSSLSQDVLDGIDLQNQLLALPDRTPEQDKQLKEVTERLNKIGVTRSHPNPLFDLFAKAIANEPMFQKPELNKEDIEEQEKLANQILDKILKDEME